MVFGHKKKHRHNTLGLKKTYAGCKMGHKKTHKHHKERRHHVHNVHRASPERQSEQLGM